MTTWWFLSSIESDSVELKFYGPPTAELDEDYSLPADVLHWLSKFKKLIRLIPTVQSLKFEHRRLIEHHNAFFSINKDAEILKFISGSSEAQEVIDSLMEYKDKLRTTSITWSKTEHFDFIRPEQTFIPEIALKCDHTLRESYDEYVTMIKVSKFISVILSLLKNHFFRIRFLMY